MAKKKYNNKRKGRRSYRRRIRRPLRSIPTKMKVAMNYQFQSSLDPGIGTASVYVVRANSMYDPDVSFSGHQPRTFDQLMALYDHFTVIASKIDVEFASADNTYDQTVGIGVLDTTVPKTNINDYLEHGYEKHKIVGLAGTGANVKRIVMRCNPSKYLGRSHPLSDSQLKGSNSADCTEQVLYHIFAQTVNDSVNGGKVFFNAKVTYIAILSEPKIPTQS